jgi:hypothetical protein
VIYPSLVLVLDKRLGRLEVGLDHLLDKRIKVNLAFPAKLFLGLGRVAEEEPVKEQCQNTDKKTESEGHALDFGRTEVPGVDLDDDVTFLVRALLIDALTPPALR